MKLNILYNGQAIFVADGQTLTLHCKDKRARSNIVIEAVSDVETPTECTLSGTWVFNETISQLDNYYQEVSFVCDDISFIGMQDYEGNDGLGYVDAYDDVIPAYLSDSGGYRWLTDEYRTITFNGTQTVSREFYEWFTANAVKQQEYTLSGTWVFKENPIIPSYVEQPKPTYSVDLQIINFKLPSHEDDYEYIKFRYENSNGDYLLEYVTTRVYRIAYNFTSSTAMSLAMRQIDFGTTPQTVSAEFYDWFTANAVEKETYTLSGKYVFNPTLTFLPSGIGLDTLLYGQVEGGTLEFSLWNGATGSYNLMYLTSAASAPFPSDRFIAYTNGTWTSENLRYVDFGNTPQEVSETFYNFVNRNTVFLGGSN